MPNINDYINNMPQIMKVLKQSNGQSQPDMTNFMFLQMIVARELKSTQDLHSNLVNLIKRLETLIDKNDTPAFTSSVQDGVADIVETLSTYLEKSDYSKGELSSIKQAIETLDIKFPTAELLDIKKAVEALRFESKDKVSVSNLGEITRSVNDLKPFLANLERAIEDSKSEVAGTFTLDDESKKFIRFLQFLDTDAKNPLAVRLSDGKEFYKAVGSMNDGIRAMTGSSGNNFLDSNGSPTKANLDSSGNLKVSSSGAGTIVSGTKTVTTAGTPVQISATSTPCKNVIISGDIIVGIPCVVGDSGVVANVSGQKGIVIIPGNDPVNIPVSNLNLLYVDAQSNGGKIAYAYFT